MRLAIIDQKDITIKIDNGAIKLPTHNIPLNLIDTVLLNHQATIHTNDILKLTKANLSILIIASNNNHIALISSANSKNAELKLAQYRSLEYKMEFAHYFLRQKFTHHHAQLKANGMDIQLDVALNHLKIAKSIDEMRGIEGAFARDYFEKFFTLISQNFHKSQRSKKPPLDPLNAMLSFWYSLIYNIITIKLLSHGFEPSIGYLHQAFRRHNALSSDILEIFRAAINQAVLGIFKNELLEIKDFSYKNGGVYLKYEGRKKIWKEFVAFVEILKPQIDHEIATIRKMIDEKI